MCCKVTLLFQKTLFCLNKLHLLENSIVWEMLDWPTLKSHYKFE